MLPNVMFLFYRPVLRCPTGRKAFKKMGSFQGFSGSIKKLWLQIYQDFFINAGSSKFIKNMYIFLFWWKVLKFQDLKFPDFPKINPNPNRYKLACSHFKLDDKKNGKRWRKMASIFIEIWRLFRFTYLFNYFRQSTKS